LEFIVNLETSVSLGQGSEFLDLIRTIEELRELDLKVVVAGEMKLRRPL